MAPDADRPNQQWVITDNKLAKDKKLITNNGSGGVMEVEDSSELRGAVILQNAPSKEDNQNWIIEYDGE